MSEKERLKAAGAAMSPCGELAYIGGCGGDPAGKDEDTAERATCIVAAQAGGECAGQTGMGVRGWAGDSGRRCGRCAQWLGCRRGGLDMRCDAPCRAV
jgi:hypothetical protein